MVVTERNTAAARTAIDRPRYEGPFRPGPAPVARVTAQDVGAAAVVDPAAGEHVAQPLTADHAFGGQHRRHRSTAYMRLRRLRKASSARG